MKALVQKHALAILLALLNIEVLCLSFLTTPESFFKLSTVLYILSGLLLVIIPLFITPKPLEVKVSPWFKRLGYLSLVACIICAIVYVPSLFTDTPIDYKRADMLPILKVMAQRFWDGDPVYGIIPEIHNGINTIYLPAMWLPFVPAQVLELDVRLTTVACFLGSMVLIFFFLDVKKNNFIYSFLLFAPFFYLTLNLVRWGNAGFFAMTQEGIIVLYLTILSIGLVKKNPWWIGLGMLLCLLSRYYIAFWVPMYLVYHFFAVHKKQAVLMALGLGLGIFLFLFLPFGFDKIDLYLGLPGKYIRHATIVWIKEPYVHYENVNVSKFFKVEHIAFLHQLLMGASFVTPILAFLSYLKFKHQINASFFGIASLKLSLVVFLAFLEVPYKYLFIPSLFISIVIVGQYYAQASANKPDIEPLNS